MERKTQIWKECGKSLIAWHVMCKGKEKQQRRYFFPSCRRKWTSFLQFVYKTGAFFRSFVLARNSSWTELSAFGSLEKRAANCKFLTPLVFAAEIPSETFRIFSCRWHRDLVSHVRPSRSLYISERLPRGSEQKRSYRNQKCGNRNLRHQITISSRLFAGKTNPHRRNNLRIGID